MNDTICCLCGLQFDLTGVRVILHGNGHNVEYAHYACAQDQELKARAAAVGDIVDTWLADDKSPQGSAKIRVSEIASIGTVRHRLMSIAPGKAFESCLVPAFNLTLCGGTKYACARLHTASLIGAEERMLPDSSSRFWIPQEQPADSPSVVATKKFHDDLIIAWADAIKSKRPASL